MAGKLNNLDLTRVLSREEYDKLLDPLQAEVARLQKECIRREKGLVMVFQGWDAAGKGGAIRRLTGELDARAYYVVGITKPTDEELVRHYLWRFWRRVPMKGHWAIFDRSWYGRVLVERVEGFATDEEWRRAYDEINFFENNLLQSGYGVLKFWLHISPEEQLARFRARENNIFKNHKITEEDWRNREKWDEYEAAAEDMFAKTDFPRAPWHLIPANSKLFARIEVMRRSIDYIEKYLLD